MHALTPRRSLIALVSVGLLLVLTGCSSGSAQTPAAAGGTPSLASQNAKAGPVEVKVTPRAVSATGARFAIELDNHEIDLTGDYARASSLTVNGTAWTNARWAGDGPGGHHRSGTLSFDAAGPASGPVELRLGGLPTAVTLRWTMPAG